MALAFPRVLETADAVAAVANNLALCLVQINQVLEYNSDQAIDWGAGSTPGYITEDAAGNIQGRSYTRQEMANAIGSLDWVRKLLTNQTMTGSQGDHLGNLNHLARPLG